MRTNTFIFHPAAPPQSPFRPGESTILAFPDTRFCISE